MALLQRSDMLKKEDLERRKVDLGGGDYVYVRQMTAQEKDEFEHSLVKQVRGKRGMTRLEDATENYRAKLAVRTVCNDKGKNLFEPSDVEELSRNMTARRMELIVEAAQELNQISEEDREELVGNSKGDQDAALPSVSVSQ